uniref:Cytochrome P450 CYP82D47 n=1 Tax=Panax ginseng TaxID=4054 RepID=C7D47_PANGI|nr:RecName: Full=Cytochrome P450 CYP82D47 [Panax ginseng]AEY75221.1 cytochrome P450 CYP82D47 [Panax ginseng]
MFAFTPYSSFWVELRKITSLQLLSSRRLELLKHVRISEMEISMKQLYKIWSKKKDGSGRVLVEMKKLFGDLTLNVVLRMVAGKRYFGGGNANDDEEARRCRRVWREFFRLHGVFVVADSLPFLRWLDLGGYEKAMKKTAKEMDNIVSGWLEEHRMKRNSSDEDNTQQDFMDVMLSAVKNVDLCGFDADVVIKSTCMVLIASGTDTVGVELTWALSLLLNNRHALKKAQEELDNVVGKQRQVKESDLNNLVYLHAIIKETLRLYPAAQLGVRREFYEDCTVAGYHVPKGTLLAVNLWTLHRDPIIWSDPTEFRPERFLNMPKEVDVKGQHFELIPFGVGRRLCPGIAFGLQMLHLVLATLLHGF